MSCNDEAKATRSIETRSRSSRASVAVPCFIIHKNANYRLSHDPKSLRPRHAGRTASRTQFETRATLTRGETMTSSRSAVVSSVCNNKNGERPKQKCSR